MPATRGEALRALTRHLREGGVEQPALDARLLLCAALGIGHTDLVRDPDAPMAPAAEAVLRAHAARRLAHEPVSRILGEREFWGLPLRIDAAVLDPRPDTETLVDAALAALGRRRDGALRILDLGTGSGAILCALLHDLPEAWGLGLDRSLPACRVADANLRRLGLAERGAIVCGSWADALGAGFDLVVANPPYIPSADIPGLAPDVRLYDPAAALDGGPDGLAPYRHLAPRLPALMAPGGIAAFEGGAGQSAAIGTLLHAAGLDAVTVHHDLAGHDRVTLGRLAA